MKKALAIHDLSCFGKCSLTVALPILSACGVETTCLPTAVLSTHTGGITGFTYRDLTDDLLPIADHWRTLGIGFDGIYTGFLGSFAQIGIVREYFDRFPCGLKLVDPVLGDNGALYTVFDESFPAEMKKLCAKADVIVPNMTEAALLLGEPFKKPPYRRAEIEEILGRLCGLGAKSVVLTGVAFDETFLGAACMEASSGRFDFYLNRRIEGFFHGTGDVFGSVLFGGLMRGRTLPDAMKLAVDFTLDAISRTAAAGTDPRFGVHFEPALPKLVKELNR